MVSLAPEFDPFLKAWHALPRRTHPVAPARRDINPITFGELLHHTGLAEMRAHKDLKVLFYGSGIERVSGLTVTGKNYYDLLPPEFVGPMSIFHDYILGTPCGAYVGDVVTVTGGSRYLYESLQFPVADDDGKVRYLLVFGQGRKPYNDDSGRDHASFGRANIKDMYYIDLGAGAPTSRIKDFEFHR